MRLIVPLALIVFIGGQTMNQVQAGIVTKTVDYEQGGVSLKGYLAYDDTKTSGGKLPGVLVIPEWWGLNDFTKKRAQQLAELGYVAFGVDMYGQGETTENKDRASQQASQFYGKPLMAERAQAALDQLVKSGLVDKSKLAAIGFCFGGSTAEALAYSGAPVVGIVSFHGGPVPAPASVTGKVKTKFLLLNGAADPMVSSDAKAGLEKSLHDAKIDFQTVEYPGALHAYTNPDADRLAAANGLVGKIGYNEAAAHGSWEQMKTFLHQLFGR